MTEMHILDPHCDILDIAPWLHYEHLISRSEGEKNKWAKTWKVLFIQKQKKKHQHMDGRKQQRGKTLPP